MLMSKITSTPVSGKVGSVAVIFLALACAVGGAVPAPAGEGLEGKSVPIPVYVDIRPGLCPNHLRTDSPLTIPIAIIGTMGFEVAQIDPATVRLSHEGVTASLEPASWAYKDVGTPVVGGSCACHKLRGDGMDDLEFHFTIRDVVKTFGLQGHPGETIELTLKGNLMTGEEIKGSDCAVVIAGSWDDANLDHEICMLSCRHDDADAGQFEFAYYTALSDRVTLAIYDVKGRMMAELNNMDMAPGIYTAVWDGTDQSRQKAPAGMYFARVSNSLASDTRKISILQ